MAACRERAVAQPAQDPAGGPAREPEPEGGRGLGEQVLAPVDQGGAAQAGDEPAGERDQGRVGLDQDDVAAARGAQEGEERAGVEARIVDDPAREVRAPEVAGAQPADLGAAEGVARRQQGRGIVIELAPGEDPDRAAAAIERLDQVGQQLGGRRVVGMEVAVDDQQPPLVAGARRRERERHDLAGALEAGGSGRPGFGQRFEVHPLAEQDGPDGARDDAQIEPEAGVLDVPEIERQLLRGLELVAAVDLRPAGDARARGRAAGEVLRQVARQERSGADQRHVADQDVDQLRQLVQPGAAQEPAEARGPLRIRQRRAGGVVGEPHGPELVEGEGAQAPARADLTEQERRAEVDQDGECHQHEQGREGDQGERAADDVAEAAQALVAAGQVGGGGRRRRRRQDRDPDDIVEIVDLQAVTRLGGLEAGPRLGIQIGPGGHDHALRRGAAGREVDQDAVQVANLPEHGNGADVAADPVADVVDDPDHAQRRERPRLHGVDQDRGHRVAAVHQHRRLGARRGQDGAGRPARLEGPVGQARGAQHHDQHEPLHRQNRQRHQRLDDQHERDQRHGQPRRRSDDRDQIRDRRVAPDAAVQAAQVIGGAGRQHHFRHDLGDRLELHWF